MSGIFDQIINYSPPLIVSGTVNYKGTWNASTNNPTLNNPPATSTKGDYYVVSTAGTQFTISFAVGDWIISSGTAWEKVDLTDAVSSVFGRTGAVVGVSTDYSAVGLTATAIGASSPSTGAFTTVSASTPIAVASGGTGVSTSTGTTNVVLSNSPTIVTPVIAQINDASGNETLKLASIASAVNEVTIENAATGNPVHIRATGGDASVGLHLVAKGASGYVNVTDGVDETKRIMFNAAGGTTNTRTMLSSTQTVDRTISLPDATGTLLYGGGPLGTPSSGTVTNLTGTASININGTVGATTRSTVAATTVNANSGITLSNASNPLLSVQDTTATTGPSVFVQAASTIGSGEGLFGTTSNHPLGFYVNAVKYASLTTTGLAVTGALSSTTGATFATSSGNVGIGVASPAYKLDVDIGAVSGSKLFRFSGASGQSLFGYADGGGTGITKTDPYNAMVYFNTSNGIELYTASTQRLVVNSSGNVGIGTTSPAAKVHVYGTGGQNNYYTNGDTVNQALYLQASGGASGDGGQILFGASQGIFAGIKGFITNGTGPAGALCFQARGTTGNVEQRMYIDSTGLAVTGQLALGGATEAASIRTTFTGNTIDGISLKDSADQSNAVFAAFRKSDGAGIGSITRVTTTTAVAYNTTSDGRLKENLRDFTDSGRLIDSLKPRVFDWKNSDENGKNVIGFIAQEEHAADPIFAHIGAVSVGDEDSETITKQWQRSDSALIPILVAELQSLRQRVAALESN
jgi:hypothetical protein